MLSNLTGWHALIILAVIVLMFGAAKLPLLARSIGQSLTIFKSEVRESKAESAAVETPAAVPAPAAEAASRI